MRANEARSPAVRPEPRSASIGSVRVATQAGAAPKSSPVSSARPLAKASTIGEGVVSIGRMVAPEKASDNSRRAAAIAMIRPAAAPRIESTTLSTSASVMICPREAPMASRTAVWPRRATARASSRLATLAHGDQQHQRAHREQDAQAATVLLLHHADAGAGRHHGDHLLRQHSLDFGQPVGRVAGLVLHPLAQDAGEPRVHAFDGGAGSQAADHPQPRRDRLAEQRRFGADDERFLLQRHPHVGGSARSVSPKKPGGAMPATVNA